MNSFARAKRLVAGNVLIVVLALAVAACSRGGQTVPLPSSAKHYVPVGTLEPGQITVPFPWNEQFADGWERWLVGRDTSGRPVLQVEFHNQTMYSFPIQELGTNRTDGQVTLGGMNYRVVFITVNTDEPGTGSGWITVEPVG